MAFQGIDVRQTGDRIVFRAYLIDSTGAILATGTTNLRLYELQNDGTIKSYDFSSNTFKTTALTTENQALTHRTGNNSTTNTGFWSYALTTLTGFTAGNIYVAQVTNTGASPATQTREFQFGVSSALDPYDGVRAGLTALPNAAAGATGGLIPGVLRGFTAQAGSSTSITLDAGASAVNGFYDGLWVTIIGGTGAGQVRMVGTPSSSYVGSTKVAPVLRGWATAPDNTSVCILLSSDLVFGVSYTDNIRDAILSDATRFAGASIAAIKAKTDSLAFTVAGQVDANTLKVGGTTQTARDLGASVLLSTGTGTGQLDFTAGVVKSNLAQILGTALTETAGQIAAAFKKFFNIATPAATMDHLILVDTATTLTNAPSDSAGVTTLLTRLTATRAGLMDNLSNLDAAISSRSTYAGADTAGTTTLLARLTATRAGLLDSLSNLDVVLSTRLATSGYTAPPTAVQNADALLGRNIAGGSSTGRTVTSALRKLRNKVAIAAGTMTVYQEDDSTADHTETVATTAGNPISSTDPDT